MSHEEKSMKCNDYELHACRDKVFDRLCKVWEDTKNENSQKWQEDIWRKANTLQTVAQYWHTSLDATRKQKAMVIITEGYNFYHSKKSGGYWVDDYGWWHGFFADLRDYTHSLPLGPPFDQANLLAEAQYCYTRMAKNLDKQYGGIWNTPNLDDPACEKNTITNDWMLNVSANLFMLTGDGAYKNTAEAQYKWLTTGKYLNYSPPNWRLYTPEGLLLWVADGPHTLGPNHGSPAVKDAYWSGDEGVYLRGLTPYINGICPPAARQGLLADCQKLMTNAIAIFTDKSKVRFVDVENVMHESPRNQDWSNDLATGKGVFMRLATRFAVQHNYFSNKPFETAFKAFVNATAESAWCSGNTTTGETGPNWNPKFGPPQENEYPTKGELWPQVFQTDGLDALNAAVQISTGA
jgi:hypothetical protein